MRRPGTKAVLAALIVALLAAPAALSAVRDRIQVGQPGNAATKGFAPSLAVVLNSPPELSRVCCYDESSGAWGGPRFQASGNAGRGGQSRVEWVVSYERSAASMSALAGRAAWRDGREVARGTLRIPHVVAGRRAGTLPGYYLIEAEAAPSARHLVVVVVRMGRRLNALVVYDLAAPFSDSAGDDGVFTVDGARPSEWNRRQARAIVSRVGVEGDLPPGVVSASVVAGKIEGAVRDDFGHPVSEIPVRLMKKQGAGWRVAGKTVTATTGRYRLATGARGTFRVTATLAGSSATSRRVALGSR